MSHLSPTTLTADEQRIILHATAGIRLDMVRPVSPGSLRAVLVDGRYLRWSETASRYLVHHVGRQLTGKAADDTIEANLKAYADALLESLK